MIDTANQAPEQLTRRQMLRAINVAKIRRDLEAGKISVRTDYNVIASRYGSDAWRDYKEALRECGYDHGCLVLADDANGGRYVAMMEHFGRDITPEEAGAYFIGPLCDYIERTEAADKDSLPENVVRLQTRKATRYTVYRLPFGDYSKDSEAFFEDRAQYIWDLRC